MMGAGIRRPESGYAVLAMVAVVVALAGSIVAGWATLATRAQSDALAQLRQAYLDEVRAALLEWYARELGRIDRTADAPEPGTLMREAGIAPRWGLRLAASARIERDGIAYRMIAAWLPGEGDASLFEPASGRFTPSGATHWIVVSGFPLQRAAVEESRARLDRLARHLEMAYRARLLSDPSRDVTVNRFRALRCPAPAAGELPCLADYVPVANSGLSQAVGLDPLLSENAWGGPIEASNGVGASQENPFSMALRTATPWGSVLLMNAVSAP
jgi:hypothetical protein